MLPTVEDPDEGETEAMWFGEDAELLLLPSKEPVVDPIPTLREDEVPSDDPCWEWWW